MQPGSIDQHFGVYDESDRKYLVHISKLADGYHAMVHRIVDPDVPFPPFKDGEIIVPFKDGDVTRFVSVVPLGSSEQERILKEYSKTTEGIPVSGYHKLLK